MRKQVNNVQSSMRFYKDLGPAGMWLKPWERLKWLEKRMIALRGNNTDLPHQEADKQLKKYEVEFQTLGAEIYGNGRVQ